MEKVIVCITTYNLEEYVAQALDSVLAQKTNFKFKIIVADDCSTDKTCEILADYQRRFSSMIEVIWSPKNLGSLANSNRIFDGIQCEYFSFLDGDDYWIGVDRLQKQVDFLDANPDYVLCAGNTRYLRKGELAGHVLPRRKLGKSYSFEEYMKGKMPFFHTSSILVRNVIFCEGLPRCYFNAVDTFENCALRGEDFRRILHLQRGKLFAFDEVFSVYRIHAKGMWQGSSIIKQSIEGAIGSNFYRKYFKGENTDFFEKEFKKHYRIMMIIILIYSGALHEYKLGENESKLLSGLLLDLSKGKDDW